MPTTRVTQSGWYTTHRFDPRESARARLLSCLECVGETRRAALDDLAEQAPGGWSSVSAPDIGSRTIVCQKRTASGSIWPPTSEWMDGICWQPWSAWGENLRLCPVAPAGLEEGEGVVRSPSDPEAESGTKRETTWLGDNVQLTETCLWCAFRLMRMHVIVQAQTTVAPLPDITRLVFIHQALTSAGLKPEERLVETGAIDADGCVQRVQRGIQVVGPSTPDSREPGQSRHRVRSAPSCHRWGSAARGLPARTDQCAGGPDRRTGGDPLCSRHLCELSSVLGWHAFPRVLHGLDERGSRRPSSATRMHSAQASKPPMLML